MIIHLGQTKCTFMPFELVNYVQFSHCKCQVQHSALVSPTCKLRALGLLLCFLLMRALHNYIAAAVTDLHLRNICKDCV